MKCQNCINLIQFLKINGYKNIILLEKYIYDDWVFTVINCYKVISHIILIFGIFWYTYPQILIYYYV